jgi:hypothetical protein
MRIVKFETIDASFIIILNTIIILVKTIVKHFGVLNINFATLHYNDCATLIPSSSARNSDVYLYIAISI